MRKATLAAVVAASLAAGSTGTAVLPSIYAPDRPAPAAWRPTQWQPKAIDHPALVYVLDRPAFARSAILHGHRPTVDGFAVWSSKECRVYVTPATLRVVQHELLHCLDPDFEHEGENRHRDYGDFEP